MPLERFMDRFSDDDEAPGDGDAGGDGDGGFDLGAGGGRPDDGPTPGTDSEPRAAPDGGAAAAGGGAGAGAGDYRVDELEEDVEENAQTLENVERSQEEIADSVEEMNDTVRELLGMYSQVTAADNPFVEDDGFGVVEDDADAGATQPDPDPDPGAEPEHAFEPERDPDTPAGADAVVDGEAVSFEDLAGDGRAERTSGRADGPGDDGDDAAAGAGGSPEGVAGIPADRVERRCLLPELPGGYAAEVVVFEWLSMLVTSTGPAAALKALAYYEEVGWISSAVREHLDMALSGPDLDIHVDPTSPLELTAADHAESYAYIKQLRELEEMEVTFAE